VSDHFFIEDYDLKGTSDTEGKVSRCCWYLEWGVHENEDETVDVFPPESEWMRWDDRFVLDLVRLQVFGVRGYVEIIGDAHDYTQFQLDNEAVRQYDAEKIYPDVPTFIHTQEGKR